MESKLEFVCQVPALSGSLMFSFKVVSVASGVRLCCVERSQRGWSFESARVQAKKLIEFIRMFPTNFKAGGSWLRLTAPCQKKLLSFLPLARLEGQLVTLGARTEPSYTRAET